jgi:signal peptidase I
MIRFFVRLAALVVIVALALLVLGYAQLVVWPVQSDASMAPTIPACDGRVVAEGFSYKITEPSPGDVVAIHAAKGPDGRIAPDPDADDLTLLLRVAAGPGDTIVGRNGRVWVNDVKFDDIQTAPFKPVELFGEQYFVLGDNRSAAYDSRDFGPILEGAIFARAFFVVSPLGDIGRLQDRGSSTEAAESPDQPPVPPGEIDC